MAIRAGMKGEIRPEDESTASLLRALVGSLPDPPVRIGLEEGGNVSFCLRRGRGAIVYLVNNGPNPSRMRVIVRLEGLNEGEETEYSLSDVVTGEAIEAQVSDRGDGVVTFPLDLPALGSRAIRIHPGK